MHVVATDIVPAPCLLMDDGGRMVLVINESLACPSLIASLRRLLADVDVKVSCDG